MLGSVRKILAYRALRASERGPGRETFCQPGEARADPAILFQSAEHPLDDVALPVLRTTE